MTAKMNCKDDEFSIIVIPDTQNLSQNYPVIFKTMTEWIVDHAEALNLKMILHLGDVVNSGANDETQFHRAQEALDIIYKANIPILTVVGNHDYDNMLAHDRSLNMFNQYFGVHKYENKPWFGGTYDLTMHSAQVAEINP